ncbi:MAG: MmgE/PrpD family protein [Pseudomonadota bacterium]
MADSVPAGDRTMAGLLAIADIRPKAVPETALRMATLSLYDWMVVARAGAQEPVAKIVRDLVMEDGGTASAHVVGGGDTRLPARAAALANGTISHALDYDDTHFGHVGHLSVAVLPAALAVGEAMDASAPAVCHAFLLGAEAACRVGQVLGRDHYLGGFHQTATSGAFGASVAAGVLYGLSTEALRNAISLVSTRASGLKVQFGTMGKPFNAGMAAANGVEAAALADRGFISADDGFGGVQGFAETHTKALDPGAWQDPPPDHFLFEDNKYKLHACCHGAHAMIEAILSARGRRPFDPEEVAALTVRTNPRWLRVCDVKRPRTGLEVKFSYAFLAAMVMADISTASNRAYGDDLCTDPRLKAFAARVAVEGDDAVADTATTITIALKDGATLEATHDLADPMDLGALEEGLRKKAAVILTEEDADRLWDAVATLEEASARDLGALIAK